MATQKLRLTWNVAAKWWQKMCKSKTWTRKRGVRKSDDVAYKQTVAEFEACRATSTGIAFVPDKLHAKQYEKAIAVRQRLLDIELPPCYSG